VAALGGTAEVLFLGEGDDVAQFGQSHSQHPSDCRQA
jgi:hypothetical protein